MSPAMATISTTTTTTTTEHSELVEEMQHIEKLPVGERIKLAQKRRKQQLSTYAKWIKTDTAPKPAKQNGQRGVSFSVLSQLMEAASRGSYEEMRALLKGGIDPNLKNHDGLTALHQCCIDGSVESVALLIKYGADVNVTDQDKWTPLHAAATCGHFKVVTMLVKAGANVTAVNGDGDMPHDITEEEVTLQYLRNEMMKRNISPDDLERIRYGTHDLMLRDIKSVLARKGDLNQPVGKCGETFLHVAIAERYNDIVKLLLENGASVTVKDRDGWQAVHVAAHWCNEEVLETLATNLDADLRAETNDGDTPYELCDDPDLKLEILHILKDRQGSVHSHHSSEDDITPIQTVTPQEEDALDRSLSSTITEDNELREDEDMSNAIQDDSPASPLINIEATEMHSDRRNSFKDVKHNAPMKRMSIERGSNKERQSITLEGIKPLLLQKRGSMDNAAPPSVPSTSQNSYRQFYEMVHPDPETGETAMEEEQPRKVITPKENKQNGEVSNDKNKGGNKVELNEGVMLRPRKKNPAPAPPRTSLQDLKRQRQEEREYRLQQGTNTKRESLPWSTTYSQDIGRLFEAPPSPSMIRYKFKMTPDDNVKTSIIREKKCIIM